MDRIAPEQQLVDGIVGKPRGVVGVVVAERQAVDALAEKVRERVPHLAGLALIDERGRQSRDQAQTSLCRREQDRTAIGAGVGHIERRRQRPVEQLREQNTLCGKVGHEKTSVLGRKAPR